MSAVSRASNVHLFGTTLDCYERLGTAWNHAIAHGFLVKFVSEREVAGQRNSEPWFSTLASRHSLERLVAACTKGLMRCPPSVYNQPLHWQLIQGCSIRLGKSNEVRSDKKYQASSIQTDLSFRLCFVNHQGQLIPRPAPLNQSSSNFNTIKKQGCMTRDFTLAGDVEVQVQPVDYHGGFHALRIPEP